MELTSRLTLVLRLDIFLPLPRTEPLSSEPVASHVIESYSLSWRNGMELHWRPLRLFFSNVFSVLFILSLPFAMFKASVMRLEWSETDVLYIGIICISVCIPNCCCMSAFHKSTWRYYSSYSYMNCICAFLFLILRPLFRYTKSKVECCAPLQLAWKSILRIYVCFSVRLFWFPLTAINSVSFLFLSFV